MPTMPMPFTPAPTLVRLPSDAAAATEARWQECQPISVSLPIVLPNGAVFRGAVIRCAGCQAVIDGEALRGIVSRPIPGVATLEAYALCRECRLLTPVHFRVRMLGVGMRLEWCAPGVGWVARDFIRREWVITRLLRQMGLLRPRPAPSGAGLRRTLAKINGEAAQRLLTEGGDWIDILDYELKMRGVAGLYQDETTQADSPTVALASGGNTRIVLGLAPWAPTEGEELGPLRWAQSNIARPPDTVPS